MESAKSMEGRHLSDCPGILTRSQALSLFNTLGSFHHLSKQARVRLRPI